MKNEALLHLNSLFTYQVIRTLLANAARTKECHDVTTNMNMVYSHTEVLLVKFRSTNRLLTKIKSAIPQRQTDEWCRITCRPGSANYFKY